MHVVKVPCTWKSGNADPAEVYYDIEVEGTHCYFANGIRVSNSHIKLAEPMPNPILEKAIRALTGLSASEFEDIMNGKLGVNEDGKVVPAKDAVYHAGRAIHFLLSRIDRDRELDEILNTVADLRGSKLDAAIKKAKILRALKRADMQPTDYIWHNLPVLPPIFRPLAITTKGDVANEGLTEIYKSIALDNEQLKSMPAGIPEEEKQELRAELYDGLRALVGLGGHLNSRQGHELPGILDLLHGSELKHGYFQRELLKRRQDMSARGVITPDIDIGLEEVGIPEKVAKVLYGPFVIAKLLAPPFSMRPTEARDALERGDDTAMRVLEHVMAERPLAMKRDPVLHKHSVVGFTPKIVPGNSIHINPLVVIGYNADHDGDALSLFVPVTTEAVEDVKRMMASRILRSPSTGSLMFVPTLESQLGLYLLTKFGKETHKRFDSEDAVLAAYKSDAIGQNDVVRLNGKRTTAGRLVVASLLPKGEMRDRVLFDESMTLTKDNLHKMLDFYANNPAQYKAIIDKLKDLGFKNATARGWSIRLSDFRVMKKLRDEILARADIEASHIPANVRDRNARLVEIYSRALDELKDKLTAELGKTDNRIFDAYRAGSKINWTSLRQMLAAPVLISGPDGPVPIPIRKSYAEGLTTGEYWLAAIGARKSMFEKTQEVSIPGALNKQLSNLAMSTVVTETDCKTKRGILLDVGPDIMDRYLAEPVKLKNGKVLSANTLVTSEVLAELQKSKKNGVLVRSPLRCQAKKGMCKRCLGLSPAGGEYKIGDNVGIMAAQALGERGVQLALKSFHGGGSGSKRNVFNSIQRVRQIVNMPEILPGSATLARENGVVSKIERDPAGGWRIWVRDEDHYVPHGHELRVRKGDTVKKGDPLSTGVINPRELLPLAGINAVQNYLADSLHELYGKEGVRRIHSEIIARNLTNLAEVTDPGDHPDLLRGDTTSVQDIEGWNAENKDKRPVRYNPILKGAETLPLEVTEDWMTRLAYRKQGETLQRGVAENWVSKLHGTSPVPGLVYGAEFGTVSPEKGPY